MPRALKPEAAAKKIVQLVSSGDATNVDDAIANHPELAVGKALLLQATEGVTTSSTAAPTQPTPRPRASGPALLSR